MRDQESPFAHINRLMEERRSCSDAEILAELRALPVLPDENDPAWEDERTWRDHADVFDALGGIIATRRLRDGVILLLERACYGDPGEMMRGLRHTLEAVYAPQYEELQPVCIAALSSPYPGARFWAANELAILGDSLAVVPLLRRLEDEQEDIRQEALWALRRICKRHEDTRSMVIEALRARHDSSHDPAEAKHLEDTLNSLI